MDRRKLLVWAGVSCVASSLLQAINFLSFEPVSAQEAVSDNQRATFYTQGRFLYDKLGNKVILRGVNKMSIWDEDDPTGSISFPEIRKTGANSVRIPWAIRKDLKPGTSDTDPTQLDALITTAKTNHLIPMIDLHDATGEWNQLQKLVEYWIQPAVVNIIQNHQEYLLVNIGNEVGGNDDLGNDLVSEDQFIEGYSQAIQKMRAAGIHTPLVIDASIWGKNLDILDATADRLLDADPEKNLLFSVHLYWSISDGADANFIRSKLQKSVHLGYPLIVGEFSSFGGYAGQGKSMCSPDGEIDYRTIIEECHNHEIGWYAWEWGPGNAYTDPLCSVMDMTPDRLFDNLKPGWATEVATSSPHSIKNTSVTPPTM
jgi:mannan endo-1,4-beta-mannosidase